MTLICTWWTTNAFLFECPKIFDLYIERASPAPYLELFGRKQVPGWTVWGNEIPRIEFRSNAIPSVRDG